MLQSLKGLGSVTLQRSERLQQRDLNPQGRFMLVGRLLLSQQFAIPGLRFKFAGLGLEDIRGIE